MNKQTSCKVNCFHLVVLDFANVKWRLWKSWELMFEHQQYCLSSLLKEFPLLNAHCWTPGRLTVLVGHLPSPYHYGSFNPILEVKHLMLCGHVHCWEKLPRIKVFHCNALIDWFTKAFSTILPKTWLSQLEILSFGLMGSFVTAFFFL